MASVNDLSLPLHKNRILYTNLDHLSMHVHTSLLRSSLPSFPHLRVQNSRPLSPQIPALPQHARHPPPRPPVLLGPLLHSASEQARIECVGAGLEGGAHRGVDVRGADVDAIGGVEICGKVGTCANFFK